MPYMGFALFIYNKHFTKYKSVFLIIWIIENANCFCLAINFYQTVDRIEDKWAERIKKDSINSKKAY
jgi:hypothetical protein